MPSGAGGWPWSTTSISTGASLSSALRLVRRMEAEPVVIGTLMTEGGGWKEALGEDAALVRTLGSMPLFHPDGHRRPRRGLGLRAGLDRHRQRSAGSRPSSLQQLVLRVGLPAARSGWPG